MANYSPASNLTGIFGGPAKQPPALRGDGRGYSHSKYRKNVAKAIESLNRHSLIEVEALQTIPHRKLATLIRPSGYFNQKAKKLKNLSNFLQQHPLTALGRLDTATAREMLLQVNGIGPETADSIRW